MRVFAGNVVASVIGGILVVLAFKALSGEVMSTLWARHWAELVGLAFVIVWLSGYAIWELWTRYRAFQRQCLAFQQDLTTRTWGLETSLQNIKLSVGRHEALQRWVLYAPETDAAAAQDENLYNRLNRLIHARLQGPPTGPRPQ